MLWVSVTKIGKRFNPKKKFNERTMKVKMRVLSLELIHFKNLAYISDKDLAVLE